MDLQKNNRITRWSDTTKTYMVQLDEYITFRDLGKDNPAPVGHKTIWVHLLYYVKHDVCNKDRLVDYGHLTDI